jgi:hypothetical protein
MKPLSMDLVCYLAYSQFKVHLGPVQSERDVSNVLAALTQVLSCAAQTRQRCRSASDGACGGASSRLLVLGFSWQRPGITVVHHLNYKGLSSYQIEYTNPILMFCARPHSRDRYHLSQNAVSCCP